LSGSPLLSALSGSTFFKPPALPEVTDWIETTVLILKSYTLFCTWMTLI
jgi:hypothetical protein